MKAPKKLFLPAIALSLLLGGAVPALAERHGMDRLAKKLDLTEEQVSAISALGGERGSRHETRKALREQIKSLIEAGDVDAAAALASEAAGERVREMAAKRAAMAEILTPEQLAEWESLKERRGKRHGGPGRRHHGGEQDYQ